MHGIKIRTNARHARTVAGLLGPTREANAVARGVYFIPVPPPYSVQRDADFLTTNRIITDVEIVEGDQ